jgi:hypothetical protein
VIVALGVLWLVVPLLLAGARWPSWWSWIAPEQSPMTWLQSVVLMLAAAVSLLIAHVIAMAGEPPASGTSTARDRTAWWVLAAGFGALAVDERFALHERVRDGVLAPRDITVPFLPWVAAGDFLLLMAALVGLALLPMVWRALAVDAAARTALAVGVGLAALAVGMDSIDPATWTPRAERVQQTAEEVVEWAGGLALVAAVTLRLLGLLDAVMRPREGASAVDPAVTGVATRDT